MRIANHLSGEWRIVHGLNMTEAGMIAARVTTKDNLPKPGALEAGHPISNTEVWLENDEGEIVGPGKIGEIVVKGPSLALGYWNDPELTSSVFHSDPTSGVRVFRTGDLGRFREDGALEYVGRKGRRLRIRGFSIEPLEIENELRRLPGVQDALVISDSRETNEPTLVGYVLGSSDVIASTVRASLGLRLSDYMRRCPYLC